MPLMLHLTGSLWSGLMVLYEEAEIWNWAQEDCNGTQLNFLNETKLSELLHKSNNNFRYLKVHVFYVGKWVW